MCGLYGWQMNDTNKITNSQRAVLFAALTLEMDRRGGDSFGLYADGRLTRGVTEAAFNLRAHAYARARQLLAHTRKATTGGICAANAHPFEIGSITGAHNGIVHNYAELNERYKREFAVDSMHIFAHIAHDLPLSEIEAYGAIAFLNRQPEAVAEAAAEDAGLYLGRFNGGELAIYGVGQYPDASGIVWASTPNAVERAATLAGLETFRYEVKQGALYHATNGRLYATHRRLDFTEPAFHVDWRNGTETRRHTVPSGNLASQMLCELCEDCLAEEQETANGLFMCASCTADFAAGYWGEAAGDDAFNFYAGV